VPLSFLIVLTYTQQLYPCFPLLTTTGEGVAFSGETFLSMSFVVDSVSIGGTAAPCECYCATSSSGTLLMSMSCQHSARGCPHSSMSKISPGMSWISSHIGLGAFDSLSIGCSGAPATGCVPPVKPTTTPLQSAAAAFMLEGGKRAGSPSRASSINLLAAAAEFVILTHADSRSHQSTNLRQW